MTRPSNIQTIEAATGKAWDEWVLLIDGWDGRELTHKAIAERVQAELEGEIESPGWWAQGVTVAYEQYIGRREPGQRGDGMYEFSVSRTFPETKEAVYEKLLGKVADVAEFDGMAALKVRQSVTPVRCYWKCDFPDGAKLTCAVESRAKDKAALVVTVAHLYTSKQRDDWRSYWQNFLSTL